MIRSLRRVAEEVGHTATVIEYRGLEGRWRATPDAVQEANRLIRHFGNWRRAREALDLSATNGARKIKARFRPRRLDHVWRYTEQTLQETLERCSESTGARRSRGVRAQARVRVPPRAAQGNKAMPSPSPHPYRRCYKPWEGRCCASATRQSRSPSGSTNEPA